ncbi:MAG: hypothetical protein EOO55_01245 [Hymenobacter sp.]|nr:MAG: hypothetical protein EOO55_01245 [Hymenobacter sp.]
MAPNLGVHEIAQPDTRPANTDRQHDAVEHPARIKLAAAGIRAPLPAGAVLVARPGRLPTGEVSARLLPADAPTSPDALMAVPRHPTQLYEALYCVLLTAFIYYRWNRTKARTPRGLLLGLFMVLLFTQRFLVEFLKEAQVDFEKDHLLNQGQLLSLPPLLLGLWLLWRAGKDPQNPYGHAPRDLAEPVPTAQVVASLPAGNSE